MCLTAHLPVSAGPRRCRPPSHYKIYISICHISTLHPSRQALTLGPSTPSLPAANARLPALAGERNKVRAHGPGEADSSESTAIRANTRKETHATPTTHTRREARRHGIPVEMVGPVGRSNPPVGSAHPSRGILPRHSVCIWAALPDGEWEGQVCGRVHSCLPCPG